MKGEGGDEEREKWLGPLATVCDGELEGIAIALKQADADDVLIIADSQATIQISVNVSKGRSARTAAERRIAVATARRHRAQQKTKIGWIKAHIGVTGNEAADVCAKRAAASYRPQPAPEGDVIQVRRGERATVTARDQAMDRKAAQGVEGEGVIRQR